MIKNLMNISLILLCLISTILQTYGAEIKKLNSSNILSPDSIEITIDNIKKDIITIKENDSLYVPSTFFTDYFKTNFENNSYPVSYLGVITDKKGNKEIYVPLIDMLNFMGLRYTCSSLYGKNMVRIRTDKEFIVNTKYCYIPSEKTQKDEAKYTSVKAEVSKTQVSNISSVNYNTGSNIYSGGNYPAQYNYYYAYPPNYQPGYYFGSYGFISQGSAKGSSGDKKETIVKTTGIPMPSIGLPLPSMGLPNN